MTLRRRAAHIAAFTSFAVTQPIFDLVGRNPTFFSQKEADPSDLIAFAAIVALLPFCVVFAVEFLVGRVWGAGAVDRLHPIALVAFGTCVFMPVVKRLELADGVTFVAAVVLGALTTVMVLRAPIVSRLVAIAAIGLPVFPLVLIFMSPASGVLRTTIEPIGPSLSFERTPDVFILRTDEFPLSSILEPDGSIDEERFPNLYAFAESATWYPRATTTNDSTRYAVPAMFTGRIPPRWKAQIPSHHPESVFTALGGVYEFDGGTEGLCAPSICARVTVPTLMAGQVIEGATLSRLLTDALTLYAHIVGTEVVTDELPPAWQLGVGDSFRVGKVDGARAVVPDARWVEPLEIVDRIQGSTPPRFSVISVNLPHFPWTLLPSGQTHSEPDWDTPAFDIEDGWSETSQAVKTAYIAHLAQVGAVDTLLGRLGDRLRTQGRYDSSMIVVISDHGQAFIPGEPHRRGVTDANVADVAAVPFMIKYPKQRTGKIDDRPVEVTDLAPTIYSVLGIDPGWKIDGRSLNDAPRPRRRTIAMWDDPQSPLPADIDDRLQRAVERKYRFLGLPRFIEDPWETFFASAKHPDLVGRSLLDLDIVDDSGMSLGLEDAEVYRDVDIDDAVLPSAVSLATTEPSARGSVAVAVNGRVVATTDLISWHGYRRADALFWPGFLRDGANRVEAFLITEAGLAPIALSGR